MIEFLLVPEHLIQNELKRLMILHVAAKIASNRKIQGIMSAARIRGATYDSLDLSEAVGRYTNLPLYLITWFVIILPWWSQESLGFPKPDEHSRVRARRPRNLGFQMSTFSSHRQSAEIACLLLIWSSFLPWDYQVTIFLDFSTGLGTCNPASRSRVEGKSSNVSWDTSTAWKRSLGKWNQANERSKQLAWWHENLAWIF